MACALLASAIGAVPAATAEEASRPVTSDARSDGVSAAVRYGWGRAVAGDEFDGRSLDTSRWVAYNSAGHAGNGLRRPGQITQSGGVLTISGTSAGTTGGLAYRQGIKYGRWETRMRVPSGDVKYHPVLLLWPDAEDFPVGGEIDYAETTAASAGVAFFLHFGWFNQIVSSTRSVNLQQWHNYAVEWTPRAITGYVDGVPFFHDTEVSRHPPRAMHASIQLDWFPQGSARTTASSMQVDWHRFYFL